MEGRRLKEDSASSDDVKELVNDKFLYRSV
jgi:hypothetical protein